MVLRLSDQSRYAAAATFLAVIWAYRKRQRAKASEESDASSVLDSSASSTSSAIPPFRRLETDEVQQLRAQPVRRIPLHPRIHGSLTCEVAVLGSGSGGGMPSLSSLLSSDANGCSTCASADVRNKRTPQSVLVRVAGPGSDESFVALVDCTQAVKRQMCIARSLLSPGFQLDAVLVTAGCVEKFLGMNDLREVQQASKKDFRSGTGESLTVYGARSTVETVKTALPFLFAVQEKTKTLIAGLAAREVSEELGEYVPMSSPSVTVRAIPGEDEQLGFVFGRDTGCVVVLPGPHISSEAREWLAERDVRLLLIGSAADRAELIACAQLVKAVKPCHAVVSGLSDHSPDHAAAEDMLQAEVGELSVSVAYDGMMLEAGIEVEHLSQSALRESLEKDGSCVSSGSTTAGSGSSGGDTFADEDRSTGLSPTHGPAEATHVPAEDCAENGRRAGAEGRGPPVALTPALTPVTLTALAQ